MDRIPSANKLADFVNKSTHIHISQGFHINHPRYVNLRTQEMFDNLVDLYAIMFITKWQHYEHCMQFYSPPAGVPLPTYAARCYISMWFIDLYVSNRNALRNSFIADNKCYQGELPQVYDKYDRYLALLNESIRPTHVNYNLYNGLYIPVIVESLDVGSSNPFGINNFTPIKICYKFSQIMDGRSLRHSTRLSNDGMGRSWWLFDWHSNDHVCSWFSQEGNYEIEDVSLAYVLGTACTPNLGPKDVDEWQYFVDGSVPRSLNPKNYDGVAERGFYGSYEVRTIEVDTNFSLTRALAAATTCARAAAQGNNDQLFEEDYKLTPRFRLIDWLYHDRVIFCIDNQQGS